MSDMNCVYRGGSWYSTAGNCRSANRLRRGQPEADGNRGFRVVKETKPDLSVFCGGGWGFTAEFCRSAFRGQFFSSFRFHDFGLRVVKGETNE